MFREDTLSAPVPGEVAESGCTVARSNPEIGVYEQPFTDRVLSNTYEMIVNGMKASSGDCLGWRTDKGNFQFYTYPEVHKMIVTLGTALLSYGLKKGDMVGIFAANCPNWTIADAACSSQGITSVPLYDSLGPGAVEYIINHAQLKFAFVQDTKVPAVLEILDNCPTLQMIVAFGAKDLETVGTLPEHRKVTTMASLISRGTFDLTKVHSGGLDDLAMIMYTSGTTGNPKGVMLTNRCMVAGSSVGQRFLGVSAGPINPGDTMLSFLPLAHIFGQVTEKSFLVLGAKIAYWRGDARLLLDDLLEAKPTILFAVPRIYARFEQRIREKLEQSSYLKRTLFDWAYSIQVGRLQNFQPRVALLDKLVFNKIREQLLPNVRFCVTGAAPMSKDTQDFLKVVLVAPVAQGYGLTETSCVATCAPPNKLGEIDQGSSGNCGGPMNGWLRLADVPDMQYLSTDKPFPQGEVCIKGPHVFTGYYKNEEATREVLASDGWFHTGDIGRILPDGSLQIIDRKKNLFKLSQGEYVAPEHIEGELVKCKLVGQLWVYGNSLERTLVGIVVPDAVQWKAWAEEHKKPSADLKDLSNDPELKTEVLAQLKEKREASGFRKFEDIVDIRFMTEQNELGLGFHVGNDLMTPTFKLKRKKLQEYFQSDLDDMYAQQAK